MFTLEERGMMKQVKYVLEHFIAKYPDQIQLYRDLAKVYTEIGAIQSGSDPLQTNDLQYHSRSRFHSY